jgi:hypothetical protein
MQDDTCEVAAGFIAVEELGAVLGVAPGVVAEYVALELVGVGPGCAGPVLCSMPDVARLARAMRLARDLDLHAAAAVLMVELLDERDDLRRRVACLERIAGGES